MIIDQVKVFFVAAAYFYILRILQRLKVFFLVAEHRLQFCSFSCFPVIIIIYVKITFFFICCKQCGLYRYPIHIVVRYGVFPFFLEAALLFKDKFIDDILTAFYASLSLPATGIELLCHLRTRMERSLADSPSFLVQILTRFRLLMVHLNTE